MRVSLVNMRGRSGTVFGEKQSGSTWVNHRIRTREAQAGGGSAYNTLRYPKHDRGTRTGPKRRMVRRHGCLVVAVRTCTILGSRLLPSANSSNVSLPSLSMSMRLKILSTRCFPVAVQSVSWVVKGSTREAYLLRGVLVPRMIDNRSRSHLVN